jgi:predicted PurR-regulated permease PerM
MPEDPDDFHSHRLDAFAVRALVFCSILIGLVVLALFIWYSLHVVLLIFAGILMAILLRGLSDAISSVTGLRHGWSLAIVLVVTAAIFTGVGYLAAPSLAGQVSELSQRLPAAVKSLRNSIADTRVGALLLHVSPTLNDIMSLKGGLLTNATGILTTTFGTIVTVVVVLFTGVFLAAEPALYVRGLVQLVPRSRRDRFAEVVGAVGYTLKWWLIGQAIDMVVIGVATGIGVWLLGVPLALLIGFLAGAANFIPNFGPLVSLIPACLLAMTIDPHKVLYVVILYIVLQSLEGYVLQPTIQRRAVQLPAAITIMAQVLLGILAGPLGLMLATPLAAMTLVAIKMLYVEDLLGDRIPTPAQGPAREEVREVKKATQGMRK